MTTLHRHLAAVWFADIVGYTKLSEENEGEAVRLAHAFQRAARTVVERFGGRIVKSMGDGALAEFSSSEMAVRSAHALLAAFARAADSDGLRTSDLRVGVHVGDVAATDDGDLYGDGVNVASRLQSAAQPGEVWVSEDVWRQLRRRPELGFDSRGEHALKGIGQPMQAYAVDVLDAEEWTPPQPATTRGEAYGSGGFAALARRPLFLGAALALVLAGVIAGILMRDRGGLVPTDALAESAAPGVAVVPFSVNDPELQRWEEGMVDLLSTNLDGAGGLRAIDSRTVLARWRELVPEDGVADLPTALEVARRAGGKYGLVGSAVSSGEMMRLSAELYDLEGGEALGNPQVEGSPDSIFGLVDRLSIQVLSLILEREGGDAPTLDLASVTTSSLPALKSFLEAEGLARRGDFLRAIPAYESAIEADSTFALAHYRLGDAHGWSEGLTAPEVRQEYAAAERFASRLPVRDADLLEVSMAYANSRDDATRLARQATQQYPDDPGAWYLLGEVYYHMPYQALVNVDEQREPFARAVGLDPTYLPAEIHLIDIAFQTDDREAADSLMQRFDPLTAGSYYGEGYTTAYALAFGDSVSRSRALAALDSIPFDSYRRIGPLLSHPRFLDMQAEVFHSARSRPEYRRLGAQVDFFYGQFLLQRGELGELLDAVEARAMSPQAISQTLMIAAIANLPIPVEVYDAALSSGGGDPATEGMSSLVAVHALETGDRQRAKEAIEGLRAGAASMLQSGDSMTSRVLTNIARTLDARDAMLQGREAEALAELEAVYRESGFPPAAIWAAEILAAQDETERAIRYLEQLGPSPMLGLWLGELYEKADRREDALEAYGWVTLAWEGSDPSLQPRVTAARQAIARLEGLQRG
jgi:class 3 adenylate cyclase/tetratricopeptide (TPR) repeat protein